MGGSQPYISVRKYIKWGDDPAGENTDTLVLTTAAKNFVDIRIYLPHPSSSSPLLPPSGLEWGFAGTSSSTSATSSTPAHTIWTHWIDSKTTDEVQDEGDMYPQSNGETMEYGAMENPDKGVVERYEECWVDESVEVIEGERGRRSWCYKMEGEGRGMVVRIGGWIQAVVRRGEVVCVGRWKWAGKEWKLVVGVGETGVPEALFEGGEVREGEKVKGEGGEWVCVESFSW